MKKILILILAMINIVYIYASDANINLSASNLNLSIEEAGELNLTVNASQNIDIKNIKILGEENIKILGTSKSESRYFINGKRSYIYSIAHTIRPIKTGKFVLQAELEIDGKKYSSNKLEFNFIKQSDIKKSERRIYFEIVPEKKKIYFGEKIAADYKVVTKDHRIDFPDSYFEASTNNSFIEKDIDRNITQNNIYIDGERALEYTLKKVTLLPVTSGTQTLESKTFVASLALSSFQRRNVFLTSEPVDIEVLSLPKENMPDNFSGILGKLNVETSFDKDNIPYGEAVTLNVRLFGNCNLDIYDSITKNYNLEDFKIYETLKHSNEKIEDDKYFSEKVFEIIIIPKNKGKIKFPNIEIPYFNTDSEKYENARIGSFTINVTGGSDLEEQEKKGKESNEIKIDKISVNNNFNNNSNVELKDNQYFNFRIKKIYVYRLFLSVFIILIFLIGVYYIYFKNKNSKSKYKEYIENIKKEKDIEKIFEELNKVIKDRFDFSLKSYSNQKIAELIYEEDLKNKIMEILSDFENKKEINLVSFKNKTINIIKKL